MKSPFRFHSTRSTMVECSKGKKHRGRLAKSPVERRTERRTALFPRINETEIYHSRTRRAHVTITLQVRILVKEPTHKEIPPTRSPFFYLRRTPCRAEHRGYFFLTHVKYRFFISNDHLDERPNALRRAAASPTSVLLISHLRLRRGRRVVRSGKRYICRLNYQILTHPTTRTRPALGTEETSISK